MIHNQEKTRGAITEQASEWYVATDEAPLNAADSATLTAWFKTSPVHVEEFLGVSGIGRDLKAAAADPEYSLEAILARAQAEDDPEVRPLWPRVMQAVRVRTRRPWLPAAVSLAACAVAGVGWLVWWIAGAPSEKPSPPEGVVALKFQTRHGEQLTRRLADNSVLHLNTDSAVIIRYSKTERFIRLIAGEADFEVVHELHRAFRVQAGSAEVLDLGTKFDVRLEQGSTVITVVEGRVAVGLFPTRREGGERSDRTEARRVVQLAADEQIRVTAGEWPATPVRANAQKTTAWLRREIAFDHEPLELVVMEYNRYAAKPIEIGTDSLRGLKISGIFATDDPDAFIAFLRTLKGVRVEVLETRIRVW